VGHGRRTGLGLVRGQRLLTAGRLGLGTVRRHTIHSSQEKSPSVQGRKGQPSAVPPCFPPRWAGAQIAVTARPAGPTAALRPGSSGATFGTDHPGGLPAYEPPSLGALPAPTPPRPRFLRSPRLAIFYRPPPRGVKPGPIRRGNRVMAGGRRPGEPTGTWPLGRSTRGPASTTGHPGAQSAGGPDPSRRETAPPHRAPPARGPPGPGRGKAPRHSRMRRAGGSPGGSPERPDAGRPAPGAPSAVPAAGGRRPPPQPPPAPGGRRRRSGSSLGPSPPAGRYRPVAPESPDRSRRLGS